MTHLDFDHAGGIEDFPEARVHLMFGEQEAALARHTPLDRMRYRAHQWGETQARWHAYSPGEGEHWYDFSAVRSLDGLAGDDIALVPLMGHMLGHAGVAVRSDEGWLLLAGDAYFWHEEMNVRRPRCTPGLRAYQWLMQKDAGARHWNQRRLRALEEEHGAEVRIVCSHDPIEFELMAGRRLTDESVLLIDRGSRTRLERSPRAVLGEGLSPFHSGSRSASGNPEPSFGGRPGPHVRTVPLR